MNILYVNWMCFGAEDALESLQELGHTIYIVQLSDKSHEDIDWDFVLMLEQKIKTQCIDLILSFNYFPTLSEAALICGCKYMSFIYDSPSIKVYSPNVINPCNFVFTFDSAMYEDLMAKGVQTIYYSPLPVNTKRLNALQVNEADKKQYYCDIAFVGSLYNEKHHLYERLKEKANDPHLIGFLEGVMEAQLKVYGYNFISECLTPSIIDSLYDAMPFLVEKGMFTDLNYVYSDYFLCRRLAYLERSRILERLSMHYKTYHYTNDPEAKIGAAVNMGKINYFTEMPKAFRYSKINLNMTLRSIKNGIPLRAMDIMGAGGFLLTNFQQDFLQHFDPDKDFVYYSSIEELEDKAAYYIKHDTERVRIAKNGLHKIEQNHTYLKQFRNMLNVVNG